MDLTLRKHAYTQLSQPAPAARQRDSHHRRHQTNAISSVAHHAAVGKARPCPSFCRQDAFYEYPTRSARSHQVAATIPSWDGRGESCRYREGQDSYGGSSRSGIRRERSGGGGDGAGHSGSTIITGVGAHLMMPDPTDDEATTDDDDGYQESAEAQTHSHMSRVASVTPALGLVTPNQSFSPGNCSSVESAGAKGPGTARAIHPLPSRASTRYSRGYSSGSGLS